MGRMLPYYTPVLTLVEKGLSIPSFDSLKGYILGVLCFLQVFPASQTDLKVSLK